MLIKKLGNRECLTATAARQCLHSHTRFAGGGQQQQPLGPNLLLTAEYAENRRLTCARRARQNAKAPFSQLFQCRRFFRAGALFFVVRRRSEHLLKEI